jgi:hypothetical protein
MKITASLIALTLSGCAALAPTVRFETQHTSHATQRLQSPPTSYGYNAVLLDLHWDYRRVHVDIADGLNLTARDTYVSQAYGALAGPREVFQATISVDVWKPAQ